ncbi:MAG: 5-formyltetrahydrofolate cyclo-ligase [Hyphomicrobiaceae bacterium]|nr:5-formyltetrahydrofolate cyclo-ligase [Hyphomicrobiaceae bacterium]
MDTSAIAAAKHELRATARRIRAEAFQRQGGMAAGRIAAHGIAFAGPRAGATVSGYSPIGQEIDPLPLMQQLAGEGFGLAMPAVQGRCEPLLFRCWQPGDPMSEEKWGIREPLPSAPEAEPEIMLVPLLAFDAGGHRLGYGGGFFDRTLAAARARRAVLAIGLAFDAQEMAAVPRLDFDQRLDWVLTPSGPRKCLAG